MAASSALLLLAVSWLPPYLALHAENAALAAASDGEVRLAALENVKRAAALDPLAVSPLLTEANLLQQQGRTQEALARPAGRRSCSRRTAPVTSSACFPSRGARARQGGQAGLIARSP